MTKNPASSRRRRILAGDIGGTYSRLAIYSHEASGFALERLETYSSPEHEGLTEVLATFFEEDGGTVDAACFGLPAPIHSGKVYPLTNLRWLIDRDQVLRAVGTDQVALINDVEASAAGIPELAPHDLECLQRGTADPAGNRVVISVGTGFGVSAITPSGNVFATEAGHATFAPVRDPDFDFQAVLQQDYGHVSWERAAAGAALPRIHALLAAERSALLEGPEIVRRSGSDTICAKAVETFRRYIGTAAGNIALTLNATGGLYLIGGAAASVLAEDAAGEFLRAFKDKGRMATLLERVPVFRVQENNLALLGAAQKAITLFGS